MGLALNFEIRLLNHNMLLYFTLDQLRIIVQNELCGIDRCIILNKQNIIAWDRCVNLTFILLLSLALLAVLLIFLRFQALNNFKHQLLIAANLSECIDYPAHFEYFLASGSYGEHFEHICEVAPVDTIVRHDSLEWFHFA